MSRQHDARMRDFLAVTGFLELPDCCPHWGLDGAFPPGYCSLALGAAMARSAAMARGDTRSDGGRQLDQGTQPSGEPSGQTITRPC